MSLLCPLARNDTNCLVTSDAISSNKEIKPYLVFQPGEIYPGDQFCQLSEGPDSYICRVSGLAFLEPV